MRFVDLQPQRGGSNNSKGASALCFLRAAARCPLNPIVRNPQDKVGKPQFKQKIQWPKQNVVSLLFLFTFYPAVMPEGERKLI